MLWVVCATLHSVTLPCYFSCCCCYWWWWCYWWWCHRLTVSKLLVFSDALISRLTSRTCTVLIFQKQKHLGLVTVAVFFASLSTTVVKQVVAADTMTSLVQQSENVVWLLLTTWTFLFFFCCRIVFFVGRRKNGTFSRRTRRLQTKKIRTVVRTRVRVVLILVRRNDENTPTKKSKNASSCRTSLFWLAETTSIVLLHQ